MLKAINMNFYQNVSLIEGNIIWNFQVDIIFSYQEIANIYFFVNNKCKQRFCAHCIQLWGLITFERFEQWMQKFRFSVN